MQAGETFPIKEASCSVQSMTGDSRPQKRLLRQAIFYAHCWMCQSFFEIGFYRLSQKMTACAKPIAILSCFLYDIIVKPWASVPKGLECRCVHRLWI